MSLISGRAGERHHQRPGHPGADPVGKLAHVLGPLRAPVLDEVRLVDHHPAEAVVAEPADVPVEHLVVDHHDVGEAVDLVAVAVDHGHAAVRGPEPDLARPVGLHHVGDDDQQRVGVGRLRGEQGLGGLAQSGLVGEQERAVPGGGRGHQLRLVPHQHPATGCLQRGRLRQRHARRRPVGGVLEGPEQRSEQLPGGQQAGLHRTLRRVGEVGGEERVGELARDHGLRDDAALVGRGSIGLVGGRRRLGRRLEPGGSHHLVLEVAGAVGDDRVLGQQLEQRGVAGRGLGQDRADPVEPLQLFVAVGLGVGLVGPHPGPLLAGQLRDDLELGPAGRLHGATLGARLHLAHRAGEHRDDALVVGLAGARTGLRGGGTGCRARATGAAATDSSSQRGSSSGLIGATSAPPGRPHTRPGGHGATPCGVLQLPTPRSDRDVDRGPDDAAPTTLQTACRHSNERRCGGRC